MTDISATKLSLGPGGFSCATSLYKNHIGSSPNIIKIKSAAHDLGLDSRLKIPSSFSSLCLFECRYSLINTKDLTRILMSRRVKFRKKKKNQVEISAVILQISGHEWSL